MRCLSPRTVSFLADGKTISWSPKRYSPEYSPFQLPCGKCIECRLEYARQWAIRCIHEAQMHPENSFITLTYSDENLLSPKLQYEDFQNFMKKLRHQTSNEIGYFVTGEYGEKTKRPHWHAILFNYRPSDLTYKYSNHRGDKVYSSQSLQETWLHGIIEVGSVTFESAGYCARYAAKKLVHGNDQDDCQPISKKSSKHAIGKKFLEKYWQDIFNYGQVILPDGTSASIPRYYEKWLQKHQPAAWENYITETKRRKCENAAQRTQKEKTDYQRQAENRFNQRKNAGTTINQARKIIIESKFKRLQQHLKGDI